MKKIVKVSGKDRNMKPMIFAEWLRRQGHKVVRTESSYWYDASNHVYQAFPFHWIIHPSEQEINDFMRSNRAIALRYSTSIDNPTGFFSYHVVYEKPPYRIEDLDRRSRQNIRHGLKNCRVEQISFEQLALKGWQLECDTIDRQHRGAAVKEEAWKRRCLAAVDLPGFEAWGAFVEDHLAATLLTFQMDDCCEMITQQCDREFLAARVNNALTYVVAETISKRPGLSSMFYALQSLDASPTVDEYKFRMGFYPKPVRQCVQFNPLVRPLVNQTSYAMLGWLHRKIQGNETLAKAEGIFRFYLEGQKELNLQRYPPCLETYRESAHTTQPV
jgi:hypothetical protein